MIFRNSCFLIFLLACVVSGCADGRDSASEKSTPVERVIDTGINPGIEARIGQLIDFPIDSVGFPRCLEEDGTVRGVESKDWTSGFFPGSLVYLYDLTGDDRYLERAEAWLPYLEKEKLNGKTHDMGFKIDCSFGQAFGRTKKPEYKSVILKSAETLASRYDETIGCIKSWDFVRRNWQYPVIIDNMMNLELLFEATQLSGDSSYYHMALSHANKTLENHFRNDNSSYHVVDYDPGSGSVIQKVTHQGYADESSWARGQAWGLYGFTMVYRYTGQLKFLEQAIKIATYILAHPNLPQDKIPYWDFVDPEIPESPRDVSAAAVIASALVELYGYTDMNEYLIIAEELVSTMSSDTYLLGSSVSGPFILDHSTGNMPAADEIDVPIAYADYYFLEALVRLREAE